MTDDQIRDLSESITRGVTRGVSDALREANVPELRRLVEEVHFKLDSMIIILQVMAENSVGGDS